MVVQESKIGMRVSVQTFVNQRAGVFALAHVIDNWVFRGGMLHHLTIRAWLFFGRIGDGSGLILWILRWLNRRACIGPTRQTAVCHWFLVMPASHPFAKSRLVY